MRFLNPGRIRDALRVDSPLLSNEVRQENQLFRQSVAGGITTTRFLADNFELLDEGETTTRVSVGAAAALFNVRLDLPSVVSDTEPNSRTFTNTGYLDLDALTGGAGSITSVAATVVTGTRALVMMTTQLANTLANNWTGISYRVSGATTVVASDAWLTAFLSDVNGSFGTVSRTRIHTGLTAGTNTFTVQAKVGGATGDISRTDLVVVPL